MRHLNDDGGDDDVVPVILPTEDVPFIIPLISAKRTKEQLRPRRGAKFGILASDLSSDGEDKYDEQRSKRDYRRFQMEFVRCYAGAAIITLCIAYFVLMRPIILGRRWQYSKVSKLPPPIWETITDVRRAENFKEKLKKFFFDDDGFD